MGGERHPDGVATVPATPEQLATYERASEQLAEFSMPILLNDERPNDRLFVAAFDGTGNSKQNPSSFTNVAKIHSQVDSHSRQERRENGFSKIEAGYIEGPGTQEKWLSRTRDLVSGHTYEARMEEMYLQFVSQAKDWIDQNPNADIRLFSTGFSRGAEQAAGFTRMVEERGIQNPEGADVKRDKQGLIIPPITFTQPPLREPGTVVQVVGLFDPVATGEPEKHDRRLPASVVAGFQISALDEKRNPFPVTYHLDPGITDGGRFLNAGVSAAHSNIGGGYVLDGLANRNGNLMIDAINATASKPFLNRIEVVPDPARDVIHRSQDHQFFYRTSQYDRNGERGSRERLAPENLCRIDCLDAIPRNEGMAAGLGWQKVRVGPVASAQQPIEPVASPSPHGSFVQQLLEQAKRGNDVALDATARNYLNGEAWQAWLQNGQAQLQEVEAARMQNAQTVAHPAPEISR